ncbi:MAG: helix-turn-helix transcriptional regulator [Candidatus Korobacteraceae bacterium]
MNTASAKRDLLESLKEREFRQAFNLENVYAMICFQLRALREQRELSQAGLGRAAKMAQERISILEDPNAKTKPTLNTLLRVADAFDVGLEVRFVPFSTVLDRSLHTNMRELEVPSFTDELPNLERQAAGVIDAEYVDTESSTHPVEAEWSGPVIPLMSMNSIEAAKDSLRNAIIFFNRATMTGSGYRRVVEGMQRAALSGRVNQTTPQTQIPPSVNVPFQLPEAMEGLGGTQVSLAS